MTHSPESASEGRKDRATVIVAAVIGGVLAIVGSVVAAMIVLPKGGDAGLEARPSSASAPGDSPRAVSAAPTTQNPPAQTGPGGSTGNQPCIIGKWQLIGVKHRIRATSDPDAYVTLVAVGGTETRTYRSDGVLTVSSNGLREEGRDAGANLWAVDSTGAGQGPYSVKGATITHQVESNGTYVITKNGQSLLTVSNTFPAGTWQEQFTCSSSTLTVYGSVMPDGDIARTYGRL